MTASIGKSRRTDFSESSDTFTAEVWRAGFLLDGSCVGKKDKGGAFPKPASC